MGEGLSWNSPLSACVSFSCLPVQHWHSLGLGWLTTVRAAGWGCSCWETDAAHLESLVPSFAALVPYDAYNLHVSFSNLTFLSGTQHFKRGRKDLFFVLRPCPMHSRRASNATFRPRRSWTSLTALPLPCRFWSWLQVCTTGPGLCGASYQTQGFRHARQTCQLSSVPGSICRVPCTQLPC